MLCTAFTGASARFRAQTVGNGLPEGAETRSLQQPIERSELAQQAVVIWMRRAYEDLGVLVAIAEEYDRGNARHTIPHW